MGRLLQLVQQGGPGGGLQPAQAPENEELSLDILETKLVGT